MIYPKFAIYKTYVVEGRMQKITADIELIGIDQVNEAFERLGKGDVKYRFVIDLNTLPNL